MAIPKLNTNKEKLFFFYSYDDTNSRIPNGSGVSVLTHYNQPTALERQGNFSQSVAGGMGSVNPVDPSTGAPFPGQMIPLSRLNSIGQKLMSVYPSPNVPNNGAWNYEIVPILTIPNFQHVFRIDEKLSSTDSLYFRGSAWHKDSFNSTGGFGFGHRSPPGGWGWVHVSKIKDVLSTFVIPLLMNLVFVAWATSLDLSI